MRYPYAISPVRSVFLPLSLSFVASQYHLLPASQRADKLLADAQRALQLQRDYLLEQAVHETFAAAGRRYAEGWDLSLIHI